LKKNFVDEPGPPVPENLTTPGAVAYIASRLGNWLPWVIVVGGCGVGFYKFTELQTLADERVAQAADRVREQNQAELDAANEKMRKAYELAADMNAKAVASTESIVDVQSQIAVRAREQFEALIATQQKVFEETKKLDQAQVNAKESLDKAAAAIVEVERKRAELGLAQNELASVIAERERARGELEQAKTQASAAASKRAEDVQQLRGTLLRLVDGVLEDGADLAGVRELAQEMRADLLIDPADYLARFATLDLATADEHALDPLIGVDTGRLEELFTQAQTGPFAFWAEIGQAQGDAYARDGYVGYLEAQGDTLRGVVFLEAESQRITDVEWARSIHAVALRNPDSWDVMTLWGLFDMPPRGMAGPLSEAFSGTSWNARYLNEERLHVLHGAVTDLALLDPESPLVRPYLDEEGSLAGAVGMTRRAKDFARAIEANPSLARIDDAALRARFTGLLRAAVALDAGAARPFARGEVHGGELGQIASIALREGFAVKRVTRPDQPMVQAVQQSAPLAFEQVNIEVDYQRTFEPPQIASFRFGRKGGEAWTYLDLDFALSPAYEYKASMK